MATLKAGSLRIARSNLRAAAKAATGPWPVPVAEYTLVSALSDQLASFGLWSIASNAGEFIAQASGERELDEAEEQALCALLFKLAPHVIDASEVTLGDVNEGDLTWQILGGRLRQRWAHLDWVTIE